MFHYVYLVTNLKNGKKYIDKHSYKQSINGYYGSGHNIKKAIRKHGKSFFCKQILSIHESEDDAYDAESSYIQQLDAVKNPMYYNAFVGGKGGKSDVALTEGHKQKIKANRTYQGHNADTRRRISEGHKGKPSWHKGRERSEETKLKMSISRIGKPLSEETKAKIRMKRSLQIMRPHSEETKAKIKESRLKTEENRRVRA